MKLQLFAIDLLLLGISCGASALATSVPAASASAPAANITNLGAARSHETGATTLSKTRRKRYISQNDMLAILDYHNKVRGKVFPPASNMEYMVSETQLKPDLFLQRCMRSSASVLQLFHLMRCSHIDQASPIKYTAEVRCSAQ